MTFHDSNQCLLKEFAEKQKSAECAIKEAEKYNGEIAIPALKELRDALHHIVAVIGIDDQKDQENELYRAISHCKRAYFDAKECIFQYFMEQSEAINEKLNKYIYLLKDFVPDYPQHRAAIQSAKSFYTTIDNLSVEARKTYYDECDTHIETLKKFIQAYSNCEAEISAKIAHEETAARNSNTAKKISFFSLCTGIGGIIIGKLGIF